MELPPLVRPLPSSPAHSILGGDPRRAPGGIKWQLTTVHNRGMAPPKPLHDVAGDARTAKPGVPHAVSGADDKVAVVRKDEANRGSCQYFVELLRSQKQGLPVEKCLLLNQRRQD
ncbi:hypothetical protein J7J08_10115 [Stenotrophomonas sp. ISL-67]|uniref:hypothetical protein n=1 Tax=Stenotrophomonas sp. ISL-67 TaxID=2819171 RepID=UPI001BEC50B3|nr:hypothetical protein [Stenotrophomonas sp. ISL-67]MBT2767989.1 hypothetical protein [Stenotrophomonas sp. ISL-67]